MSKAKNAKYMQVYNDILQKITTGQYPVNEKLPNTKQLCKDYSVSHTTITAAMNQLKQDNIVERYNGKGTFVINHQLQQATLYFIVENKFHNHYYQIYTIIAEKLQKQNVACLFISTLENIEVQNNLLKNISSDYSNIVILRPIQIEKFDIELINIIASIRNLILLDTPIPYLDIRQYTTNTEEIFRNIHFSKYNKILYISGNIINSPIAGQMYRQINSIRSNQKLDINIHICADYNNIEIKDVKQYDYIIVEQASMASHFTHPNVTAIFDDNGSRLELNINYQEIAENIISSIQKIT